jgi:ABC-type glycerol-3-phosphate transport system substrate-binding protein
MGRDPTEANCIDCPMPKNRRQFLKVAGAGSIAGLAGCTDNGGGNGTTETTPTGNKSAEYPDLSGEEIHFLTDESGKRIRQALNEFVDDFKSTTGASVNFEQMGYGGTAQDRLSQLLQAGNPPDSFYGMEDVGSLSFANKDLLRDHSKHVDLLAEEVGEPTDAIQIEVDGSLIFVPTVTFPSVIWYRSDIWGDQPIEPTWNEFLSIVEKNDGKQDMPGYYALRAEETCTDLWTAFFASGNEGVVSRQVDGEFRSAVGAGENRTRWVEAMKYLKDLGQYSPRNADAGCNAAIAALRTQSASSVGYAGSRPKQTVVDADMDFAADLKAMEWPVPEGSDSNLYKTFKGWINFSSDNKKPQDVFTEFFIKEGYYEQAISVQYPTAAPAVQEVTDSDAYKARRKEVLNGPWNEESLEALEESAAEGKTLMSDTSPPNPYIGVFYSQHDVGRTRFRNEIENMPAEEVVDLLHEDLNESFNQAREG